MPLVLAPPLPVPLLRARFCVLIEVLLPLLTTAKARDAIAAATLDLCFRDISAAAADQVRRGMLNASGA